MYSFLGLGRHFRDVLRVGSKSRRPVWVFPSNFLGGGEILVPAFRVCNLTHHIHHPFHP